MKCKTKNCRKASKRGNYCYSCAKRHCIENNPMRYAYDTLKNNARRRGKEFTITFDYFKRFCKRTDYMNGKGTGSESYHIDRKDETKGYIPGNLQVLTNAENVKKYFKFEYGENGKPTNCKYKTFVEVSEEEHPF